LAVGSGNKTVVPSRVHADLFGDANGDGRRLLYIYEIAPGNTVRLTTFVHATFAADGAVTIRGNVAGNAELKK